MADPSTSTQPSDAQREEMLDRMLTRLALADDSELEQLLSKILPYTVSSLSSLSPSVRKLVMEILTHVNKRVKHRLEIGLPMLELWEIYCEASGFPMVRNFCMVYIEMSFDRLPAEAKANMAPDLLVNVSRLPTQHQDIILRIILKAIGECDLSQLDEKIYVKYKSSDGKDKQLFVEFCLHTILYQPPSLGVGCPAGLSLAQSDRITGKFPLKGDVLLKRKLGILHIIESMQLAPGLAYPLYLAAASDSQDPVAKRGEDLLKRRTAGVNLDDSDLIEKLFILFNGTTSVESLPADFRVTPVNNALRLQLMSVFCRCITAANAFPAALQCIFGCIYGSGTTSRLKQLGMEFTVWVFKHALIDRLKLMGPVILNAISRQLDGSSLAETDAIAKDAKSFAFQAIGLLAARMPQLFRDKIDMAVRLFTSLKLEDQSLRLTIQESVTSLAVAYKDAPLAVLKELEAFLLQSCKAEQSEVRFCAMRWTTSLFCLNHCPSRYICMLGCEDTKMDIREMAFEGLHLSKDQELLNGADDNVNYPKLKDMLNYICLRQPKLLDSSEHREKELLFPSKTYFAMARFLLKCFKADCRRCDSETDEFRAAVSTYCQVLEHGMAFDGSVELHATSMKALVEIGSHQPKLVASRYADRLSWLQIFWSHVDFDTREAASRLLGIACSTISSTEAAALTTELLSSINTKLLRFENHHGLLCTIGYVVAECMREVPKISESLFASIVDHLVSVVELESSALTSVSMEALGHIGLRHPLPIDINHGGVLPILHEKLKKLIDGNDIKTIQRIVVALGHISVKEASISHLKIALDLIFGLSRSKVEDVLFAAGEALSFIWGGVPVTGDEILKTNYISLSQTYNYLSGEMSSASMRWSSSELNVDNESRALAREMIIKKLFDELLYSNRKEECCVGTVWLVSLTMYCGHHPKIQHLLPEIQEAFSHHLGDQNELTQELASQGMSIVYELGDMATKQELVNSLVNTLTGSGKKKRAIKLMEDSEVFQEGAIGKSLSGGKLSTYKELCNLANEMGQPDLIYKFMDLANYQASLNSKRGAAFGFSKIAKLAGDALQPHLAALIPRLVRFQYDPEKNVQDAMANIWKSLITDSKKAIDEYFDLIVEDLLSQSGSRLWRSREASCLALADIIQGRKYSQVSKHLRRIWTAAFRAMDDIKETVRTSGDSLCRSVTSLTIRLCDISLTQLSDASETMNIVLPFFLEEGIVSKVSSIQKASINIVMKLAKGSGDAIRPHLPDLVCCMLECLSSLEDQRLNYVELHAANVGIHAEKLENLRIAASKDSTMWETLDMCIKVTDKQSLESLVPRLAQLVRIGVGLNTRVGVASFITLLVQKVTVDISPFTSMLSKLLFRATLDEKRGSAKKSFAASCAIILKYGSPSLAQKLIEDTVALHLGDRNYQVSCAVLLKNYANLAADILSGYHAAIIPVIFVSRFEDDKDVSTLYEELWEDNSTSERVTLQLYLQDIVSLVFNYMSSSSWASKRKAAKATVKLCVTLGDSVSASHQVLLECILKEVPGRFWEGKEVILHALASLCSSCSSAISTADPVASRVILSSIISSCAKKEKCFREAAFVGLQQIIRAFDDPESFREVVPFLYEVCDQAIVSKNAKANTINTSAAIDNELIDDSSLALEKVLDCITACIHVARVEDVLKEKERVIHILTSFMLPGFNWTVKLSVLSSVKELCLKLQPSLDKTAVSFDTTYLIDELFHSVAPNLFEAIRTVKIAQLHTAASECILEIVKLNQNSSLEKKRIAKFRDDLVHLIEIEKSEQARTFLRRSIEILQELEKGDSREI
ncbi:proteasome-associated protein ECM29 homolog isoform X2 [Phalaenopsis equestris]|uniref:proteasome-associated protein ECM29 homolog isoform X2 n=1 Tax=Phalaenopsis equestris TaxID=78828 RepID=UPI0009E58E9D|nr:proteasome-associated protein ECM29 homolog isoform X2 [Phalaenopsis equestris]